MTEHIPGTSGPEDVERMKRNYDPPKASAYQCLTCGRISQEPGGNCEHEEFQPLWPVGEPVRSQFA